ncbi:DUF551 domain-containing protein [Enterobacter hormaechei]
MAELTKEWLQKTIAQLEEERDAVPCAVNEDAAMALAAMKLALASLEAEPVAFADPQAFRNFQAGVARREWMWCNPGEDLIPLYAAPPVPVSVKIPPEKPHTDGPLADGWNACRAAMLQGAEPVTTAYKLPDDFDFDRFNDVVWLEAVASNPHMHSPTTSTIAMVALELNKRLETGNSPVIPDGWVACSERMPEEGDDMIVFTDDIVMSGVSYSKKKGFYLQALGYDDDEPVDNVTHWMPLPSAPQQEADNG